jgi:F420-dependent oxidoreductase-like protein
MTKKIRFGVQVAPQNATWAELLETWKLVDSLRYDTAWVFDHFFAILSDPSGPCFEGWIALTALAAQTPRVQAGVLVTGNTYRHPAVLAKMAATLDHAIGGRLIMGIGGAWFEQEHNAYGIPFYTTAERIGRVDEATEIIKRLWSEKQVTFEGRYYQLRDAYCEPKPLQQPRPPIMIGGSGEKLMLRVVAKHADLWNTFGSPEVFRHKIEVLKEHCSAIGRNFDDIEVSWAGACLVSDSRDEINSLLEHWASAFGITPEQYAKGALVGSPSEVQDQIAKYIDEGLTHFIPIANAPFNQNSIRRFAEEVIPAFQA